MVPRTHHARRLAVVAAATAALLLVVALALPVIGGALAAVRDGSWRSASFEDLLVGLCAVAALAAGGCWWAGVLRLVLAAVPGVDAARVPTPPGLPAWVRRVVLAACGTALVVVPTGPALALAGPAAVDGPGTDPVAGLALPAATGDLPGTGPRGLPLPDRVAGELPGAVREPARPGARTPAAPSSAPSSSAAAASRTVQVVAGDSLWRIAERQLRAEGRRADDAAVVARWQQIYAANAARIGPDPDLVLPGQRLDLDHP